MNILACAQGAHVWGLIMLDDDFFQDEWVLSDARLRTCNNLLSLLHEGWQGTPGA